MRPNTLRTLRRYHHYLGVFFAPMILLFSVSGVLQTFRLQEARGYGGTPPNWIVWIASVHKDQGPPRPPRAEQPKPAGEAAKPRGEAERAGPKRPSTLPLKIFVVLLSIALCASTITGVMIALSIRSMRRVSIAMLVAGTIVPLVLLWI
ncbi:hypothetical protein [Sphingomonas sp. 10B4]|uniref:hypothetical protein n=1 Tax=Sphingomonas sp. 10B4 TaxID=3048575 RepID=UPI002AB46732|nr:hypothetical protein [Sphingomonas sp. 10B4]MDY7525892.1 hypothetical protein [Sphingomonas sp. 10B4]MEB0283364.1 hypothetical protein [Sphingomonas sp. 10B4]